MCLDLPHFFLSHTLCPPVHHHGQDIDFAYDGPVGEWFVLRDEERRWIKKSHVKIVANHVYVLVNLLLYPATVPLNNDLT